MRSVMWDMIRADQYVSDFLLKDSTKKKKPESLKLYDEVFRLHKVTQDMFKKSLDFYSANPLLFQPILDSLAKRNDHTSPYNTPPVFHLPPGAQHRDSAKLHMHKTTPK